MERCPNCGGALKIIVAIEDPPVIAKILTKRREITLSGSCGRGNFQKRLGCLTAQEHSDTVLFGKRGRLKCLFAEKIYCKSDMDGFDFKLNVENKPFTTPPTVYKGPDAAGP